MSIVFITIEGEAKREFANILHEKTDGAVSLIIVQQRLKVTFLEKAKKFFKNWDFKSFWYSIKLTLEKDVEKALGYFRHRTSKTNKKDWPVKVIYVPYINSEVVHEELKAVSPSLMVVWGAGLLKPHIINTAEKAINLHMGYAPHYRGAVGNQFALYNDDLEKIGATIHHINNEADAGDIIETIKADANKPIKELFKELNDKAEERFLETALKLYRGEKIEIQKQNKQEGKTYLLKDWTPYVRYSLGKKILDLENNF